MGRRMAVITCVEDLKDRHKKRVPRMFYDYAESGSWTESTYRRNEQALNDIRLRQKVAVDLSFSTCASSINKGIVRKACTANIVLRAHPTFLDVTFNTLTQRTEDESTDTLALTIDCSEVDRAKFTIVRVKTGLTEFNSTADA